MKILWLGHNLAYPPNRGVLQRNYNLLRQAAKSCEIHVLAFDQPASRPAEVGAADCERALREFCAEVTWVSMANNCFGATRYWHAAQGLISRDPYDFHWLRSGEMTRKLQGILNHTLFDAVHFDTIGLSQYRKYVNACGTVMNHHNIESSMMTRRVLNEGNLLRREYCRQYAQKLRSAEKKWCPRFDVNVVVSKADEEELTEAVPKIRSTIVPNGTDIEYFTPRPDPGGTTLLFCGGLDWYPNIDAVRFFFDVVWPKLLSHRNDVEIHVVGRNPPDWLVKLSANDSRIHVTGFVKDVRPYFRKATAYICPIKDGGGTRLKVLDALAMGMPLVGTSFACSGLSLNDGEHVLLADTPEGFVDGIKKLLNDALLRKKLSRNGRELVERVYSWNVVGKSLVQSYKVAAIRFSKRQLDCH